MGHRSFALIDFDTPHARCLSPSCELYVDKKRKKKKFIHESTIHDLSCKQLIFESKLIVLHVRVYLRYVIKHDMIFTMI